MSDESSTLIQLGFVGAPFGVRGWIKLRSHTDPPERLLDHRNLRIGRGGAWKDYRIEASGRSGGPGMVVKALPLRSALREAVASLPPGSRRVYLGADGRRFEQGVAREACN